MYESNPSTLIIVLSDHGFKSFQRGIQLNTWLRNNGYDQPIESGGITAWKEAGYEVVQPKSE